MWKNCEEVLDKKSADELPCAMSNFIYFGGCYSWKHFYVKQAENVAWWVWIERTSLNQTQTNVNLDIWGKNIANRQTISPSNPEMFVFPGQLGATGQCCWMTSFKQRYSSGWVRASAFHLDTNHLTMMRLDLATCLMAITLWCSLGYLWKPGLCLPGLANPSIL